MMIFFQKFIFSTLIFTNVIFASLADNGSKKVNPLKKPSPAGIEFVYLDEEVRPLIPYAPKMTTPTRNYFACPPPTPEHPSRDSN